jgi:translation initiation factor IF-2
MISVKEFSEKTGVPFPELMKVMMSNKIMGGINTNLDYDTASLIGEELGVKINKEQDTVSVESILEGDLKAILDLDKEADNLIARPPIVTIMGHVDHGKTSLLDYLRKTDIAGGEAGGITQSIGASTITHGDKQITFIDTPGHELFTTMRARGAKLTDIVVIIVAADDGLMPQTIESINHAKEAGVPIIVAITKIDKPGANKQQDIRNNIGSYELIPEERGGDVPVVEISSVTGQGIDDLLEHISIQAEVLELTYNPDRNAVGVVLDAKKSAQQGIETSLIVMTGKLRVGDVVVIHNSYGKIKRMIDRTGKAIKEAHGGEPVLILGINDAPEPGRIAE